jgi:hypothetical protein
MILDLKTDPLLMKNLAKNWATGRKLGTTLETFFSSAWSELQGAGNMNVPGGLRDTTGQLSQAGHVMMNNIFEMEKQHTGALARIYGPQDHEKIMLFQSLVRDQVPVADISKMLRSYGSAGLPQEFQKWDDEKGKFANQSQDDWVLDQFKTATGTTYPSANEYQDYKDSYNRWYKLSGDQKLALQGTNKDLAARSVTALNKSVVGGNSLERRLQDFAAAQPTLPMVEGSFLANMLAADPTMQGKDIPNEAASLDSLLKYGSNFTAEFHTLYKSLGLPANSNTGRYDNDLLQTSKVDISVPAGENIIRFVAQTPQGPITVDRDLSMFTDLQMQFNGFRYEQQRTAELEQAATTAENTRHLNELLLRPLR